ncbi:hypothetical protein ACGLHS_09865 [Variovorax sp. VaC1]|uniref:hypothetical protein n=1 Tax=Variovorax sp. VaC1 TaxID=3373132 RepID=UPI003747979E
MTTSKIKRFQQLSIIAAAATLAACGGGGDGGGGAGLLPITATTPTAPPAPPPPPPAPPAPAPAPATADSSACTNAADYDEGTQLTYDLQMTTPNQPTTSTHNSVTTGKRQPFAGATPVTFEQTLFDANNTPFTTLPYYRDLVGGNVIRYGDTTGSGSTQVDSVFTPPPSTPVAMQPGQTVNVAYRADAVSGNATIKVNVTEALTYQAQETLATPVGTFNTCRFLLVTTTGTNNAPGVTVTVTSWIAAEGPYRGQRLKSFVAPTDKVPESTSVVTQMTYTPK